jgi:hypothetical protein
MLKGFPLSAWSLCLPLETGLSFTNDAGLIIAVLMRDERGKLAEFSKGNRRCSSMAIAIVLVGTAPDMVLKSAGLTPVKSTRLLRMAGSFGFEKNTTTIADDRQSP